MLLPQNAIFGGTPSNLCYIQVSLRSSNIAMGHPQWRFWQLLIINGPWPTPGVFFYQGHWVSAEDQIVPALSDNYMHLFWSFLNALLHCFPEKKLKTHEESIQKTHSQLTFPRQAFYETFTHFYVTKPLQNPMEMVATWSFFSLEMGFSSRGFNDMSKRFFFQRLAQVFGHQSQDQGSCGLVKSLGNLGMNEDWLRLRFDDHWDFPWDFPQDAS